jgi:hypothetical protein
MQVRSRFHPGRLSRSAQARTSPKHLRAGRLTLCYFGSCLFYTLQRTCRRADADLAQGRLVAVAGQGHVVPNASRAKPVSAAAGPWRLPPARGLPASVPAQAPHPCSRQSSRPRSRHLAAQLPRLRYYGHDFLHFRGPPFEGRRSARVAHCAILRMPCMRRSLYMGR